MDVPFKRIWHYPSWPARGAVRPRHRRRSAKRPTEESIFPLSLSDHFCQRNARQFRRCFVAGRCLGVPHALSNAENTRLTCLKHATNDAFKWWRRDRNIKHGCLFISYFTTCFRVAPGVKRLADNQIKSETHRDRYSACPPRPRALSHFFFFNHVDTTSAPLDRLSSA